MKQLTCESCKYFCQHYVKIKSEYIKTACGHCIYPMVKTRYSANTACDRYREKK